MIWTLHTLLCIFVRQDRGSAHARLIFLTAAARPLGSLSSAQEHVAGGIRSCWSSLVLLFLVSVSLDCSLLKPSLNSALPTLQGLSLNLKAPTLFLTLFSTLLCPAHYGHLLSLKPQLFPQLRETSAFCLDSQTLCYGLESPSRLEIAEVAGLVFSVFWVWFVLLDS